MKIILTGGLAAFASNASAQLDDSASADIDSRDEAAHQMHAHEPILVDPNLSWEALIRTTYQRFPSLPEVAARRNEAAALESAGRGPLSGVPSISFSHLSDAPLDDLGQREYDFGIALPLWRFGQRAAARDLGDTAGAEAILAAELMRWEVAGLLRQVLWDVVAAENELALAESSLEIAEETLEVVARRHAAGDLPLADELLARSELYAREMVVLDQEAQLLDTARAYRSLTGLDARPSQFTEKQTQRDDFDDSHPALGFANAQLARARASAALAEESSRGTPSINIGPHRERGPLGTFYSNSMQLTFNMPVGGRRYGAPERARAARIVAEAEAQRSTLLRELDLQLHEAEHELSVAERSLDVANERADLANRQLAMGQSAFAQGEIDLRTLLRIQEAARTADSEVAGLQIQRSRMIAMFNHALGEIP
ncbi:MAG: TolC family protein [Gammaproteobacteria bacterium]